MATSTTKQYSHIECMSMPQTTIFGDRLDGTGHGPIRGVIHAERRAEIIAS